VRGNKGPEALKERMGHCVDKHVEGTSPLVGLTLLFGLGTTLLQGNADTRQICLYPPRAENRMEYQVFRPMGLRGIVNCLWK
jgi:hypothetical protein